jgi:hypothetical protein
VIIWRLQALPVLRPEERRRALRQQGLLVPRRRAQPNLPTRRQPRTQPTRRQSQRTCSPHRAGGADPASRSLPAGVADPTSGCQMETFSKEAPAWKCCKLLPRSNARRSAGHSLGRVQAGRPPLRPRRGAQIWARPVCFETLSRATSVRHEAHTYIGISYWFSVV